MKTQLVKIITVFSISIAVLLTFYLKQNSANGADLCYEQPYAIEFKDVSAVDRTVIQDALQRQLGPLLSHPWFAREQGLPFQWGIIIDGKWILSSGYFSENLRTLTGVPAILFSPQALLDTSRSDALIAHELTHLMHHRFRPHEDAWVREGVALLAEWIVTGKYNAALSEAFHNPETSLLSTLDPESSAYANLETRTATYGHVLQYFIYIYRLCGKSALAEQLLTSPSQNTGIRFLNETLQSMNTPSPACGGFRESFRAFSLARFRQGNPGSFRPEDLILFSPLRSVIRDQRMKLPPYSSSAYTLEPGSLCQNGDSPWGSSRCIQIREE